MPCILTRPHHECRAHLTQRCIGGSNLESSARVRLHGGRLGSGGCWHAHRKQASSTRRTRTTFKEVSKRAPPAATRNSQPSRICASRFVVPKGPGPPGLSPGAPRSARELSGCRSEVTSIQYARWTFRRQTKTNNTNHIMRAALRRSEQCGTLRLSQMATDYRNHLTTGSAETKRESD